MFTDELEKALSSREEVSKLRDFGEMVSGDNEEKAWAFLATRTYLLLRAYPTSPEVKSPSLPDTRSGVVHCVHWRIEFEHFMI